MGQDFGLLIAAYRGTFGRGTRLMTDSVRHLIVYDGACAICNRAIAAIQARDRRGMFDAMAYQQLELTGQFPGVSVQQFESAMQLFLSDGSRMEGARAFAEILKRLPRLGILGRILSLPVVEAAAERVYSYIARNRRRFGCGEHCSVPR